MRRRGVRPAAQDAAGRARRLGGFGAAGRAGAARRGRRPHRAGEQLDVDASSPRIAVQPSDRQVTSDDVRRMSVTVRVPAKVNLQLAVGPLRDDGYHDLVNVFHAVSLFDEVTVTPRTTVAVTRRRGRTPTRCPPDADNLAARAAVRARRARGPRRRGVPSTSTRRSRWRAAWRGQRGRRGAPWWPATRCGSPASPLRASMDLAADLGSDVPFALLGGTAVGTGPGRAADPAAGRGRRSTGSSRWPTAACPPPAVYAECDRLREATGGRPAGRRVRADCWPRCAAGDAKALGAALTNDLQPAALSSAVPGPHPGRGPGVRRARRAGLRLRAHLRLPGRRRRATRTSWPPPWGRGRVPRAAAPTARSRAPTVCLSAAPRPRGVSPGGRQRPCLTAVVPRAQE